MHIYLITNKITSQYGACNVTISQSFYHISNKDNRIVLWLQTHQQLINTIKGNPFSIVEYSNIMNVLMIVIVLLNIPVLMLSLNAKAKNISPLRAESTKENIPCR